MKIKVWDIIKLKKEVAYPWYTYLVVWIDAAEKFKAWEIKKEDLYIKIINLTRGFLESPTEIEKELFWGRMIDISLISNKSVDKVICNIN